MPGPAPRPVLFLDIDGPLIPFGGALSTADYRVLGDWLRGL
jgi:hypothetical protein